MLHVKHGHVLVDGDFEPFRRRAAEKRFQLGEVQVIGRSDPFKAEFVTEIIGRKMIGNIERIIPHTPLACKESQMIVIPDQVAIRLRRAHLFQSLFLAHFEDPRRRHKNLR